ncbi:myosin heavy chain, non-muscle-like [Drosophila tropicalis]|uniref:myosin heavy chain, non-muscle-like n=1 Tax=Drosophila tropicalis TaxID=46794 RepID=UPI0035AC0844
MDQTILNLLLSNLDACQEDSASETSSIISGFDSMNIRCQGNCYQKVKAILQQAADAIKFKDWQIDNLIMALKRNTDVKISSENNVSGVEQKKTDKDKNIEEIILRYENQLKEALALLKESSLMLKNCETQKQQLKDELAEKTKVVSQLKEANALSKESNERVRSLEIQEHKLEQQLATKITAIDVQIINFEQDKKIYPDQTEVFCGRYGPHLFQVSNDIVGPGWLIIWRMAMVNGALKTNVNVKHEIVQSIVNSQRHELYIYKVDEEGRTSYAHFDNFSLYASPHSFYYVKSLDLLSSSIKVCGSLVNTQYSTMINGFNSNNKCVLYQLMIREKHI